MPRKPPSLQTNFSEIGRTGLQQYSGYVTEEFLRELTGDRGRRVIREMLANDPVINAMFFAIEMLVRQVTWTLEPATLPDGSISDSPKDLEIRDFFQGALFEDMSTSWKDTLSEVLSFLPWGFSWHEIVYKRRTGESDDPTVNSRFIDGRIGWRKWPIRSQESLSRWQFDPNGGIQAMVQTTPDYQTATIPIEKSLLFRTTSHKNNPEGKALLRACYRPWYFKVKIENLEGVGIERDLAGLPVMQIPAEYLGETATPNQKAIASYCRDIVTNVRNDEQGGLVYPSDPYEGTNIPQFEFSLAGTGSRRLFDTDKVIARKNQEILMRLMADFIILGHEKVGSFALSSNKTNMFGTALGAWLDSISEVINRHAIPRLGRLNGMPMEAMPKLKHEDIEAIDLKELGEFLKNLALAGGKLTGDQLAWSAEQAGMPVPDNHEEMVAPEPVEPEPFEDEDEDESRSDL